MWIKVVIKRGPQTIWRNKGVDVKVHNSTCILFNITASKLIFVVSYIWQRQEKFEVRKNAIKFSRVVNDVKHLNT